MKFESIIAILITLSIAQKANSQWIPEGFEDTSIKALQTMGTNVYAGTYFGTDFYRSTDSGITWQVISTVVGDSTANFSSLSVVDTQFFVGINHYSGKGYALFRSSDQGQNWISIVDSLFSRTAVTKVSSEGSVLVAGTADSGIVISNDGGITWVESNEGLQKIVIDSRNIQDSSNNSVNTIIQKGSNIFAGMKNGVFLSKDTGKTWISKTVGMGDTVPINALAALGSHLFAATNLGVFHSTNQGQTWSLLNITGFLNFFPCITAIDTAGTYLFIASSAIYPEEAGSIFVSTDSGTSWNIINDGLGNTGGINFGPFTVGGGYIFIASDDVPLAGVYRRALSDFETPASVVSSSPQSGSITAFPNPFTQSTTFCFITPETGNASITVVNTLGTEVARLYSGKLAAGEHSFEWEPKGVPNGIYWIETQLNGTVSEMPVVLSR